MNVIGTVCEYNPFHAGHEYHLNISREYLGADSPVVAVMSGDFVQRGEAAAYSKFARAKAAASCGADLVLELPLPWCLASAEGFARGAVGLLGALGVVTHLSFGSECGDAAPLERIADALLSQDLSGAVREALGQDPGVSFAAARQRALEAIIGDEARLLETPNNILGVEYIKAIKTQKLGIAPFTVRRRGAQHDKAAADGYRSASEIRSLLSGGADIKELVPEKAAAVYAAEPGYDPRLLETALLSRLRMAGDEVFERLPDAGEGLNNRLAGAARECGSLEQLYFAAKTKRYAMSRIRRMTMCAALGVTADMQNGTPPYARVLAATERGCALLRQISGLPSVPVITKPASVKAAGEECAALFGLGCAAHDLYVLGCAKPLDRRGLDDWKHGPAILF